MFKYVAYYPQFDIIGVVESLSGRYFRIDCGDFELEGTTKPELTWSSCITIIGEL